ncbi:MAG: hypothetical protein IJA07_07125 [Agathobacter sp.]|nr:hypothetical protein [Agathobacter sp.]MBQ3559264.1 hypothetical protein [Agathobacter sp.]
MWKKITAKLQRWLELCEIVIALLVGLGVVATLITYLLPGLLNLFRPSTGTEHFLEYLGAIFNLVVGLEFMKLLFHINSENVIEVLVILISRHMIMEAHEAMDIFLSTLSIVLLLLLKAGLRWVKHLSMERFHKIMVDEEDEP